MITIRLSDKMAQKLWKKLQFKQNEAWVYLRNKLMLSTGFPQVIRKLKSGSVNCTYTSKRQEVVVLKDLKPLKCIWEILIKGTVTIPVDLIDETINKEPWPKNDKTKKI